jgi:hypothetical protein
MADETTTEQTETTSAGTSAGTTTETAEQQTVAGTTESGGTSSGSTSTGAATETKPEPNEWAVKRVGVLTAQLREKERELAELKKGSTATGLTEEQINQRVQTEAQRLTAQQAFDAKAAEVQAAGRTAHPDFDATVNQFKRVVNFQNPAEAVAYNQFLQAAFRLGIDGAAKVIHDLGSDLNEAARILALSPVEMGVELGRRAASTVDDNVSRTPKPPKPADRRGGAANTDETDPDDTERGDKLSTREWMRRRNLQVEARRKEGVRMN